MIMSYGSLLEGGGRLFNIFSLKGDDNPKRRGAYLKLGANSSIYGTCLKQQKLS